MIDWKRKLTSRKFWLAVIGFVTAILIFFNVDKGTIEQVAALIMAGATVIAYIIGEGLADSANSGLSNNAGVSNNEEYIESESEDEEPVGDETDEGI